MKITVKGGVAGGRNGASSKNLKQLWVQHIDWNASARIILIHLAVGECGLTLYAGPETWEGARDACALAGKRLATIPDSATDSAVV